MHKEFISIRKVRKALSVRLNSLLWPANSPYIHLSKINLLSPVDMLNAQNLPNAHMQVKSYPLILTARILKMTFLILASPHDCLVCSK